MVLIEDASTLLPSGGRQAIINAYAQIKDSDNVHIQVKSLLTTGFSGDVVIEAAEIFNGKSTSIVIKFAPYDRIRRELSNYAISVQRFENVKELIATTSANGEFLSKSTTPLIFLPIVRASIPKDDLANHFDTSAIVMRHSDEELLVPSGDLYDEISKEISISEEPSRTVLDSIRSVLEITFNHLGRDCKEISFPVFKAMIVDRWAPFLSIEVGGWNNVGETKVDQSNLAHIRSGHFARLDEYEYSPDHSKFVRLCGDPRWIRLSGSYEDAEACGSLYGKVQSSLTEDLASFPLHSFFQERLRTGLHPEDILNKCNEYRYYSATCHGDIHLRNIRLAGSTPIVIDYGLTGPGQPWARDSVRLEVSIWRDLFDQLFQPGTDEHSSLDRITTILYALDYIPEYSVEFIKNVITKWPWGNKDLYIFSCIAELRSCTWHNWKKNDLGSASDFIHYYYTLLYGEIIGALKYGQGTFTLSCLATWLETKILRSIKFGSLEFIRFLERKFLDIAVRELIVESDRRREELTAIRTAKHLNRFLDTVDYSIASPSLDMLQLRHNRLQPRKIESITAPENWESDDQLISFACNFLHAMPSIGLSAHYSSWYQGLDSIAFIPILAGKRLPIEAKKPDTQYDNKLITDRDILALRDTSNRSNLLTLLVDYPSLLILGDPGSGKTTATRELAFRSAVHVQSNLVSHSLSPGHFVQLPLLTLFAPVPAPLLCRFLDGTTLDSQVTGNDLLRVLSSAIIDTCNATSFDLTEILLPLIRLGAVVPIIDAVNELSQKGESSSDYARVAKFIKDFQNYFPNSRIHVTSRIVNLRLDLFDFPLAVLQRLTSNVVLTYVRERLGTQAADHFGMVFQSSHHSHAVDFLCQPMFLAIAIEQYNSSGAFPDKLSGLLKNYVQNRFCLGHIEASEQKYIESSLRTIGTSMCLAGVTDLPLDSIPDLGVDTAPSIDNNLILSKLSDTGLLQKSGDGIRFVHQCIQEYFAAEDFKTRFRRNEVALDDKQLTDMALLLFSYSSVDELTSLSGGEESLLDQILRRDLVLAARCLVRLETANKDFNNRLENICKRLLPEKKTSDDLRQQTIMQIASALFGFKISDTKHPTAIEKQVISACLELGNEEFLGLLPHILECNYPDLSSYTLEEFLKIQEPMDRLGRQEIFQRALKAAIEIGLQSNSRDVILRCLQGIAKIIGEVPYDMQSNLMVAIDKINDPMLIDIVVDLPNVADDLKKSALRKKGESLIHAWKEANKNLTDRTFPNSTMLTSDLQEFSKKQNQERLDLLDQFSKNMSIASLKELLPYALSFDIGEPVRQVIKQAALSLGGEGCLSNLLAYNLNIETLLGVTTLDFTGQWTGKVEDILCEILLDKSQPDYSVLAAMALSANKHRHSSKVMERLLEAIPTDPIVADGVAHVVGLSLVDTTDKEQADNISNLLYKLALTFIERIKETKCRYLLRDIFEILPKESFKQQMLGHLIYHQGSDIFFKYPSFVSQRVAGSLSSIAELLKSKNRIEWEAGLTAAAGSCLGAFLNDLYKLRFGADQKLISEALIDLWERGLKNEVASNNHIKFSWCCLFLDASQGTTILFELLENFYIHDAALVLGGKAKDVGDQKIIAELKRVHNQHKWDETAFALALNGDWRAVVETLPRVQHADSLDLLKNWKIETDLDKIAEKTIESLKSETNTQLRDRKEELLLHLGKRLQKYYEIPRLAQLIESE